MQQIKRKAKVLRAIGTRTDRSAVPVGQALDRSARPVGQALEAVGLALDAVGTDAQAVGLEIHMGDRSVEPVGDRPVGRVQSGSFSKMMTSC